MKNLLIKLQAGILLGGSVFSGITVFLDFQRFYRLEGTIFKVSDCLIPNPVTTPCFYGFFAFVAAFIWAVVIWRQSNLEKQKKHQKYLTWLLLASTIFAWTNFFIIAIPYWQNPAGGVSCSGGTFNSPFETACFIGSAIFLIALLNGFWAYQK